MLILTRKSGETLLLGDSIEVTIVEVMGDKVKIAIDAPKEVKILRKELVEAERINKEAIAPHQVDLMALKGLIHPRK